MASSKRPKPSRSQPGPASRQDVLERIDRRTRAGRLMKSINADLVADIGGDPSAQEQLIITAATVKAVRLHLLAEKLLDGAEVASDEHNVLAWCNSLRHDLQAIGLARRSKDVTPNLSDYIASKSREAAPA